MSSTFGPPFTHPHPPPPRAPCQDSKGCSWDGPSIAPVTSQMGSLDQLLLRWRCRADSAAFPGYLMNQGPRMALGHRQLGAGRRKGRRKRGMQALLSGPRALAQPSPQPEVLFSTVHLGNAFPPKTSVIGPSVDVHTCPLRAPPPQ